MRQIQPNTPLHVIEVKPFGQTATDLSQERDAAYTFVIEAVIYLLLDLYTIHTC